MALSLSGKTAAPLMPRALSPLARSTDRLADGHQASVIFAAISMALTVIACRGSATSPASLCCFRSGFTVTFFK